MEIHLPLALEVVLVLFSNCLSAAMGPSPTHPDEYELAHRSSLDSQHSSFDLDDADFEANGQTQAQAQGLQTSQAYSAQTRRSLPSLLRRVFSAIPFFGRRRSRPNRTPSRRSSENRGRRRYCRRRAPCRLLCVSVSALAALAIGLTSVTSIFLPSYTELPAHYASLRQAVLSSGDPGRGNPRRENVFIAASIYDGDGSLVGGQWGQNLLDLIHLLGPDNVYLSVYENDASEAAVSALKSLEENTPCNRSIVNDVHLDLGDMQHVLLPDRSNRVKRIAFLAEVRNRALRPLDRPSHVQFDKLLYLNDVCFDPVEAVQLLFSTNADEDGVARYRAACSVDFINPFKFYDTFASRDLEGYGMGLPLYPWFSTAGDGQSRRDVQEGRDAVRVRSCWGGMVAFDAEPFQLPAGTEAAHTEFAAQNLARFRAEIEPFWDASECCLIHADIQPPPNNASEPSTTSTGIYMNPFIRVAYDPYTLSVLGITRRFERLYSLPQNIINHLVGLPWFNPRRAERPGDVVQDKIFMPSDGEEGSYQPFLRTTGAGGFCGREGLQAMVPDPKEGEKKWEMIPVPE